MATGVADPLANLRLPPLTMPSGAYEMRDRIRAFIADELANRRWSPGVDTWLAGFDSEFSRRLGGAGFLGLSWPTKYGGHGRTALERYVVVEELLAAGAPVAAHWISDRQTGPTLLRFGNERQREELLPKIAAGECYFAIGMSEPDSGSDLASVRTRAEQVEGGWSVTGTKVWTSNAHRAHYFIVLLRTAGTAQDRHQGLSQMIVDLQAPGVQVRPIRLLTGEHHFNEVVMEEVFVPDHMVVGELGNGWHQVTSELAYERSGPERWLSTFQLFVELTRAVGADPDERAAIAIGRLSAGIATMRQLSLGVAAALQAGQSPETQAALVKDLGTRFEKEIIEVARQLKPGEAWRASPSPFEHLLAHALLSSPGFTLRGGTNEILRGIVARGLGVR